MENNNLKEKDFQKKIISWLERNSFLNLKTHGGNAWMPLGKVEVKGMTATGTFYMRRLKGGYSDLMVFTKGQTLFIELKTDIGWISENQYNTFINLVNEEFKQNCFVLQPKCWDQLKEDYKITKNIQESLLNIIGENTWMNRKPRKNYTKNNKK